VSGVAITERDLSELDDVSLHPSTVDVRIPSLLWGEWPHWVLLVIEDQDVAVSW
jgi:hypothetical protein